jgi:ABC-2 type transport system permease protein
MMTLVGVEWGKLRSIRAPWLLLAAAQLVVVFGASGRLARAADQPEALPEAAAHVGLVSLFALVLGLMSVAGEYRHKTITDTYLGTPRRGRVLAAKLLVTTGTGLGFGLVAAAVAVATSAVWLAAQGVDGAWSQRALWTTLVGAVLWNGVFAALGVGIGALVRNLTGAIAGSLAWLALIEGVLGQVLGASAGRWLPFSAGASLGELPAGGGLAQWTGGVVLAGYAVAVALAAWVVTGRRDVT